MWHKYIFNMTQNTINQIPTTANEMMAICQKPILTAKECATYMGIKLSTLYKMPHNNVLPYSKPNGKMIFFDRVEVENWMRSNRYATQQELATQAAAYCQKGANR